MEREVWNSKIGFWLAATGSAMGLGNIWRFPYITGVNGGAAFLLVYFVIVFTIGVSVMLAEFAIGRSSKLNPVGAFTKLKGVLGL
ncbi:MAG: Sodium:neurotransmitter symporter family protein [Candidatus Methanofastidiosum methylothiophilum]|uniref:Transporter n=1 Tax=Candidatus Methanofastidiosum methylothiophilum TaxID=1705564 RepID=A0A150IXK9_9EURY|nr:MAG: Sodium:neurotransmitter symporter family protein [Candidatus Methanofastidiosum methylthiophilus]KYC47287.1 MAG: Sodium:neurotransmitter symporter family protein [Candidatus Methanofastidiosum methylthiophilus]KYC49756.1 MAG: Sodium:neurotransmitter symporter family protein [Candidatus Methanofastidiosum methylthiophilus]